MKNIFDKLKEIEKALDPHRVAMEGREYLENITPVRTGNARNRTRVSQNNIHANYPYAGALDNNHSKQTKGDGLIKPTLQFLDDYVSKQR